MRTNIVASIFLLRAQVIKATGATCSQAALCDSYPISSCVAGCYVWCEDLDACQASPTIASYCSLDGACYQYVFDGIPTFLAGCGVDDTYTETYVPIFQYMCGWSPFRLLGWSLILLVDDLVATSGCGEGSACWQVLANAIIAIDDEWAAWLTAETVGVGDAVSSSRRRSLLSAGGGLNVTIALSANIDASPYGNGSTDAELLDAVQGEISAAVADGSLAAALQASGVDSLSSATPVAASFSAATLSYGSPIATDDDVTPADDDLISSETYELCLTTCALEYDTSQITLLLLPTCAAVAAAVATTTATLALGPSQGSCVAFS